jgi:hypothetical protein
MQTAENMTGRNALARAANQISVTTREQLEAVVWRHSPGLNSGWPADRYAAMNAILAAADTYATAQCAIAINAPDGAAQAQRRADLEAALYRPRRSA